MVLGQLVFDHFKADNRAVSSPRAFRLCVCPGRGCFEVRLPKRPIPTLRRSDRINGTASRFGIKKRAIAIRKFLQRQFATVGTRVHNTNLAFSTISMTGNPSNVLVIDPHDTGCPSAAVATLCAFETKAVLVPRFFWHPRSLKRNNQFTQPGSQCVSYVGQLQCIDAKSAGTSHWWNRAVWRAQSPDGFFKS